MGLEFFTLRKKSTSGEDTGFSSFKRTSSFRLLIGFIIFILYLIFGAIVFNIIESSFEKEYGNDLRKYLNTFLKSHPCLPAPDLEKLLYNVIDATKKGVAPYDNVSAINNWGFGQSFFFSGTLVTTVGYGHVSPNSQLGKGFTIAYCIFGIPMFLIVLSGFVERFKFPSVWLLNKLTGRFGHLFSDKRIRLIHLAIVLIVLLIFMFLIPAAFFTNVEEEWTFLDSFYYCFVSLTTIGLGDYIPGDSSYQSNRGVYKISVTCYLLIGIFCMMLFMSTIYDMPQFQVSSLFLIGNEENDLSEQSLLANKGKSVPNYTRQYDDISETTTTGVENVYAYNDYSKD